MPADNDCTWDDRNGRDTLAWRTSACWIDGTASGFGMYCQAYEHRNQALDLEDADALCRDSNGVRLSKTFGQTNENKIVSWETDAKCFDSRGIPSCFKSAKQKPPTGCVGGLASERRARDSNPQPVARQLISNQSASHSRTLRE